MENEKLNVLIVDDEPIITMFIKHIVKEMGDNVVDVCYDSSAAFESIQSKKPDLIFMDINIKGPLDGISVIRKINVDNDPIVYYVSAYSSSDIINDALSTKAYNYLIKPIKEEDIKIALTLARKIKNKQVRCIKDKLSLSSDICYDFTKQELFQNGSVIKLSATEKKLVDIFITNINVTLPTSTIKELIWQEKDIANSTLRDAIYNLRKKIPELKIETNFGRGYILNS